MRPVGHLKIIMSSQGRHHGGRFKRKAQMKGSLHRSSVVHLVHTQRWLNSTLKIGGEAGRVRVGAISAVSECKAASWLC